MSDVKVIDLAARRTEELSKEKEEFLAEIKNFCEKLIKATEEDRLEQFVFQWEELKPDEEQSSEEDDINTVIMFYNREHNIEQSLGYAERLKQRIFLLSEGLVQA